MDSHTRFCQDGRHLYDGLPSRLPSPSYILRTAQVPVLQDAKRRARVPVLQDALIPAGILGPMPDVQHFQHLTADLAHCRIPEFARVDLLDRLRIKGEYMPHPLLHF